MNRSIFRVKLALWETCNKMESTQEATYFMFDILKLVRYNQLKRIESKKEKESRLKAEFLKQEQDKNRGLRQPKSQKKMEKAVEDRWKEYQQQWEGL
mmetsp:Transcript_42687/g.65501  ORF Transcript_42687/g.65501 Transcript_42687/m.65501 type:complete len:97 (-) Transcript_42687:943-1233(-)